ncbi:MAG TPA: hypothetical protein VFD92_27430 [Candidatus Binatia bacterium]|nr:hypothetical protein [Candidatus Binatia bacterium]
MLKAVRFAVSLLVALWGLVMVLLGIAQAQLLWIPLGLAVLVVGVPLLASNPLATDRLYPPRPESSGIGA